MKTQQDLFLKKSKEQLLEEFCKQKGFFSSHDVNYYGAINFFDSATRRIREWVKEGKIRRLDENEKIFRGYKTKCAIYEVINNV